MDESHPCCRWQWPCALVLSGMGGVWAQEKHAITFDDMIKLHRFGAAGFAGWKMGRVHGGDAGHGSQPQCEQHLDSANDGRFRDAIDAERARFVAGVAADGKTLAFLSSRGGESQVYLLRWKEAKRTR